MRHGACHQCRPHPSLTLSSLFSTCSPSTDKNPPCQFGLLRVSFYSSSSSGPSPAIGCKFFVYPFFMSLRVFSFSFRCPVSFIEVAGQRQMKPVDRNAIVDGDRECLVGRKQQSFIIGTSGHSSRMCMALLTGSIVFCPTWKEGYVFSFWEKKICICLFFLVGFL